jgi:hypothetical protein
VGIIVSSSGEALGLGVGVGMSVCAWTAAASKQIENPIHRFETLAGATRPLQRHFSQITVKLIQLICVNLRNLRTILFLARSD